MTGPVPIPAGSDPADHPEVQRRLLLYGEAFVTTAPSPYASDPLNPWGRCPCGDLWLIHDVDEYSGDGTETCCAEGCDQAGCPGTAIPVDTPETITHLAKIDPGEPLPIGAESLSPPTRRA